jgi:putative transposase
MTAIITESPQFFTATILEWKKLLKPEKYKDTIISSLQFLVENNRVKVNAFVIMDNHIHLIWQMMAGIKSEAVQRDFMKYTAQKIKQDLIKSHPAVLAHFKVNAKDREYQFWERNALSIELGTLEMLKQKLEYIHYNAVLAGLCNLPEEYKYSTARFYETGVNDWDFVTHYTE